MILFLFSTNYEFNFSSYCRQVRKRYFVNVDLESEDEFRPRFVEVSFYFFPAASDDLYFAFNTFQALFVTFVYSDEHVIHQTLRASMFGGSSWRCEHETFMKEDLYVEKSIQNCNCSQKKELAPGIELWTIRLTNL